MPHRLRTPDVVATATMATATLAGTGLLGYLFYRTVWVVVSGGA